jgi:elongation factor G
MKRYGTDDIRNVALVAHGGAGKTTLMEALLYVSGAIERQGRIEDGNTVSDFDPEEARRKASIHLSLAHCEWSGCKMNFIDVPGYADFLGEVAGALRAADGAIFVASAQSDGVDVGFETAWDYAKREGIARAVFVNKMDKEHADYMRLVDSLRARYGKAIAPAELPIGVGPAFHGVVDLVHQKAYVFEAGEKIDHPEGIPDEMQDAVAAYREQLIESAAESDDELLEKYLSGDELTNEEIERGLHEGMSAGKVVPVLCGAAVKDMGVRMLLDLICAEFPLPSERPKIALQNGATMPAPSEAAPFTAQVFKTLADPYVGKLSYLRILSGVARPDSNVWNPRAGREERIGQVYAVRGKQQIPVTEAVAGDIVVVPKLIETRTGDTLREKSSQVVFQPMEFPEPVFAQAIVAKSKLDEDKLGAALKRLEEENPTFALRRNPQTGETLLIGLGEAHIDMLIERLARYGAHVEAKAPHVPFLETISAHAKAEGKHKKQSGGRGQFGDCWIEIEPLERGAGYQFVDHIVGGSIPRQYIPAVDKGVQEAMARGVLAGNPVVDVRVTVFDGKFHDVDSSEAAFKMAGILAFQNAVMEARPVLLEPVMDVTVHVPEEYMGAVIGDINSRRGRVMGMDRDTSVDGDSRPMQVVRATVPEYEMQRYAIDLRSLTHGRGWFHGEKSHYEEAPPTVAQKVIADARDHGFAMHAEH